MDETDPFLTPEMHAALSPQRPPERFAERVMGRITRLREGRRRRTRALAVGGAVFLAAAASVALFAGRAESRGEIRAEARQDVRLGSRVVAVLSPGAHVAWKGDLVTQYAGDVFYRVEPGGPERVHTSAGDVTVRGTCFDVKVRPAEEEERAMTRGNARSGAVGAIAAAAVLVGVYEGKVTLSRAQGSVDVFSGQAARADARGVHGPFDLTSAQHAFESSSGDDPWRAANASLADQLALYQRRLETNEVEKKAIQKELREVKAKVAAAVPDGGGPRDIMAVDPRDLTDDDLKQLAKKGLIRTRFLCPPPGDWHATPDQIATLGLAPADAPAVDHAVAAAQAQMWQAVGPECTKILGSAELATRLGGEMCGLIIQTAASDSKKTIQLVADVLAGNATLPAGPLDPLAARILAQTQQSAVFEKDLAEALGPETAHSIARSDDLGLGCGMEFAP
jgi:hypothetical protein